MRFTYPVLVTVMTICSSAMRSSMSISPSSGTTSVRRSSLYNRLMSANSPLMTW